MIDLQKHEIWFVTGSQHLYGLETLEKVAEYSQEMAGVECLRIDADTKVETFKKELRWNEVYYALKRGI